jgi:cbb3-type cytochrome oxidase subunit 3
MLIYLNAASLRWPTLNSRFPDASSLRSDNDPIDGRSPCALSRIIARYTVAATIYLLILIVAFIGIVIWVFDRKRKARFEANARIPLNDKSNDKPG